MGKLIFCLLTLSMFFLWHIVSVSNSMAADETLVLYLPFDEGKGDTAKDLTKFKNDGTLKNNLKWADGKFGKALEFAPGSFVEIPASDSLHKNFFKEPFTISAWIQPAFAGDTWQHIWRTQPVGTGHNTFFFNINGLLSWRGRSGGAWTVLCETAPGVVKKGDWTHAAVTGDKSNFRVFVNGKETQKTAFKDTDGNSTTYYVANDGGGEKYSGLIDEVRVWKRALAEKELAESMNKGAAEFFAVDSKGKLTSSWAKIKSY